MTILLTNKNEVIIVLICEARNKFLMFMVRSVPCNTEHQFYCDPEIYHCNTDSTDDTSKEQTVFSLPSKDFGAYAASFPTDLFGEPFVDSKPSWKSDEQVGGGRQLRKGNVDSPQVVKFWDIYKSYPKYLKNVEKRKKKKSRKGRAAALRNSCE